MAPMKKILVAFISERDLQDVGMPIVNQSISGHGPICWTIAKVALDEIIIIETNPRSEFSVYVSWLKKITKTPITICQAPPNCQGTVESTSKLLLEYYKKCIDTLESNESLYIFSSHGSSLNSSSISLIMRRLRDHSSEFQKTGEIKFRSVPFNDDVYKSIRQDFALEKFAFDASQVAPEFKNIIHASRKMADLIEKSRIVAQNRATVLIQGESGTGKELFARAIHKASSRSDEPFIAVNCGAISPELIESEFFGHVKGAFTGAVNNRDGCFKCADRGTLFLDEIGELPLAAQVKILRVIQEGEVAPVGETKTVPINVRIIAATNRSLASEMAKGLFREDLFYRLAVAILDIPPLRDRIEDVDPLVDHFLQEADEQPSKKIHPGARELLKKHQWPGNVRELQNALLRASFWSDKVIMANNIKAALFAINLKSGDQVLDRPFTSNFELQDVLNDVTRHYLARAIKEAGGNKTKAAKLLGMNNQQTLTNWLNRTGM